MISPKFAVVSVGAALVLGACASIPTGPSVLVLPGDGKSFEQFQTDDAVCRQWSAQQTGTTTERTSSQSTISGAAIGTAVGAAAGAAIGAAAGSPATGAAIGAGGGFLGGAAIGARRADAAANFLEPRHQNGYI